MHLQLKTVHGSPIALSRVLAAIMDLLPFPMAFPTTVPITIQIQQAIQNLFLERIPPSLVYPKPKPEELINLAIENNITRANKLSLQGGDGPFFVADLGQVTRQHQRWMRNLPTIQPYYAIKCNSDPTLLKTLAKLGTNFDCASIEEIRLILNLGIDPSRILFANPCKSAASLVYARRMGIRRTTFDNIDELDSIKMHMPEAELLLRIYANDDTALISFGDKFGAPLDSTEILLGRARELGLRVVGVSFHVGSGTGAKNPQAFKNAIHHARIVFSQAQALGFNPSILDIGGGFTDTSFEKTCTHILTSIRSEFPDGVTTIAEPGRFYARSVYTLVSRVISRRRQIGKSSGKELDMLYQNDGVYGSFMNVIMEKEVVRPVLVGKGDGRDGEYRYSVWGPTCDGIDCVAREVMFPCEVRIGDWLRYSDMGAYTSTTATKFNGFSSSLDTIYVHSESIRY